jgi:hypothetical protein
LSPHGADVRNVWSYTLTCHTIVCGHGVELNYAQR